MEKEPFSGMGWVEKAPSVDKLGTVEEASNFDLGGVERVSGIDALGGTELVILFL